MTATRYAAGSWVAVSGADCWLLIDLPPDEAIVDHCWRLISGTTHADDLLDVLVSKGIRKTPSFALAQQRGSECRVIVRGTGCASIRFLHGDGTEIAAASNVPWDDRTLEGVGSIVLQGPTPVGAAVSLPMSSGVTLAASIHVQYVGTDPDEILSGTLPDVEIAATADDAALADTAAHNEPTPVHEQPDAESDDITETSLDTDIDGQLATSETVTDMPVETVAPEGVEVINVSGVPASDPWGATSARRAVQVIADALPTGPVTSPAPMPEPPSVAALPHHAADVVTVVAPPDPPPGLIDTVPGLTDVVLGTSGPAPAPIAQAPTSLVREVPQWATPASADIAASAVSPSQPQRVEPAEGAPAAFDVRTVSRSKVAASVEMAGPMVMAEACPNGHWTSPNSPTCRICSAPTAGSDLREILRPTLGVLRLSTGDSVTLDRNVVIGRAPSHEYSDGSRPHLVQLSTREAISRNHVEIVLEGWHVFARDLRSTNGTTVTLPGQAAVALREGQLQLLERGAIVTLADEVSCTFEVTA